MTNGKKNDHPKVRFEQYVHDRWGQNLEDLDGGDRDIALADWQTQELALHLGNGKRGGLRDKGMVVLEKGGPYGLFAALLVWALQQS